MPLRSELAPNPTLELLQNSILFLLNFFFHTLDFRLKSLFLALSIISVLCDPSHCECIHSLTELKQTSESYRSLVTIIIYLTNPQWGATCTGHCPGPWPRTIKW